MTDGGPPQAMSPADRLRSELLQTLAVALFVRRDRVRFELLEPAPTWVARLADVAEPLSPWLRFPFLESFILEAERCWDGDGPPIVRCGPWIEETTDGTDLALEAAAVRLAAGSVLALSSPGSFEETQATLQMVRERALAHGRDLLARDREAVALQHDLAASERSRDDMQTVLSRLRIGTLVTDAAGRVTYANAAAERFFGVREGALGGATWPGLFASAGEALARAVAEPAEGGQPVSVEIETPKGRHLRLDVEVGVEPRDPRGRIFVLYDRVTTDESA